MHEAKLAKYVYDIVSETLTEDEDLRGKKVKKITFAQSRPYTVVADSFEFYFRELVKNTAMEEALLEFGESKERGFFVSSIEV